jgi:hypothetical protein
MNYDFKWFLDNDKLFKDEFLRRCNIIVKFRNECPFLNENSYKFDIHKFCSDILESEDWCPESHFIYKIENDDKNGYDFLFTVVNRNDGKIILQLKISFKSNEKGITQGRLKNGKGFKVPAPIIISNKMGNDFEETHSEHLLTSFDILINVQHFSEYPCVGIMTVEKVKEYITSNDTNTMLNVSKDKWDCLGELIIPETNLSNGDEIKTSLNIARRIKIREVYGL